MGTPIPKEINEFLLQDLYKLYGRNTCLFMSEIFGHYSKIAMQRLYGYSFSELQINVNGFLESYCKVSEIEQIKDILRKEIIGNPSIKTFYEEVALPVYDKYKKFALDIYNRYDSPNTFKDAKEICLDLIKFHRTYSDLMAVFWKIYWADLVIEDILRDTMSKEGWDNDNIREKLHLAANPIKKTAVFIEEMELLQIAKKSKISDEDIRDHCNKWCWFPMFNPCDEPYPISFYEKRIKNLSPGEARKLYKHKHSQAKESHMEFKKITGGASEELKYLMFLTNMISYYREYRNDLRRWGLHRIRPLFVIIADRLNLKLVEVCNMNFNEIKESLSIKQAAVPKEKIHSRLNAYSLYVGLENNLEVNDPKSINLIKERLAYLGNMTHILGKSATKGKTSGRVRIIMSLRNLKNFKKGEVLVTSMTSPDYVPIMRDSIAIVTDEGGITSHAAVISRELGKPCVVGTRIATKIFKNGDQVEVDADKGIVRKV